MKPRTNLPIVVVSVLLGLAGVARDAAAADQQRPNIIVILAGPGIPRGKSDALVYHFDLFPTLCDLAGVNTPRETEGSSLVPIIRGEKPRVRDWLFAAYRDGFK